MVNSIFFIPLKIIILIVLISLSDSSLANEIDVSKWSYDDLAPIACEMAGVKNYTGALKVFDLAVHAAPNYPEGYINRGAVLGFLHQQEKAIQDEQMALSLAKSNSKSDIAFRSLAHQNLSGIYLNNKQFDKAEEEARIAVKIRPESATAQETLGDVLKENGKPHEALFRLKRARDLYERVGLPNEAKKLDAKITELQSK